MLENAAKAQSSNQVVEHLSSNAPIIPALHILESLNYLLQNVKTSIYLSHFLVTRPF